MAHRIRPSPPPPAPRPALAPPTDRGSPLWQNVYKAALKADTEEARLYAEKLADSALRAREKSVALMASKHKILVTKEPPKPIETVAVAAAKKGRVLPSAACRCKAMTLENRQCGFKATCGDFCKKHTPT